MNEQVFWLWAAFNLFKDFNKNNQVADEVITLLH